MRDIPPHIKKRLEETIRQMNPSKGTPEYDLRKRDDIRQAETGPLSVARRLYHHYLNKGDQRASEEIARIIQQREINETRYEQ